MCFSRCAIEYNEDVTNQISCHWYFCLWNHWCQRMSHYSSADVYMHQKKIAPDIAAKYESVNRSSEHMLFKIKNQNRLFETRWLRNCTWLTTHGHARCCSKYSFVYSAQSLAVEFSIIFQSSGTFHTSYTCHWFLPRRKDEPTNDLRHRPLNRWFQL